MKGIWQSTKAQIVFGGVPDADMLRDIEALFGETMERAKSRTRGTFKLVPGSVTTSEREVHRLPMEEIYDSKGKAFLFYRGRFTRIRPALYFSGDVGRPFYGRTGWAPGRA